MSQGFEIQVFNRRENSMDIEKVYGDEMVKFAYATPIGRLLGPVIASKMLSKLYGKSQDSLNSAKKVAPFLKNFNIQIDQYQKGSFKENPVETSYRSFNEFFIREFKEGQRTFTPNDDEMGAFAEARYFGHESMTDDLNIPVKGSMLRAVDLIGDGELAKDFIGGPLMIARLCPVDYHRYHYPDAGKTLKAFTVPGDLHSVNPLALKYRQDIFIKNERRVAILETEHFGKLAYIEVGATCVGKIVQSFDESQPFNKGDEKGYFLFGGSTVVLCGQKGKWAPSEDILTNTKAGIETYIQLGDVVAQTG
ncbi:MAG: phosphatidylserine decarboxylase [Zetaproteobacteria bacterium CG12_big_fil_rev_8_21_14_0_65_54_13]|nr:MAG: phosphatidylserine decarboxylase [Zetaproteobacteria bacterium CG12_big_fil_rev_8_21_14_0_65_54_13]PIX55573.1 MAG: phosphatidylserine decarboxylase [Zetaproteobacteria bacterium CG_4_10_14_3_um_filter_54_28]PJA29132.1 MAG: phosphatidylserine decarboxylase [Zetaproteobacteria bacterium CG_4_9_14_3_um_filter_54_145]